jgi:hypothetical protein
MNLRRPTLSRWTTLLVCGLCVGTSTRAGAQWQESKSAHYTIFYQPGYESDVAFTRRWLDATEELMKTKYGVTADRYYISIYLLPAPADGIDVAQSWQNQCCTSTSGGLRTGTIRLLARSAPIWQAANLTSNLGFLKAVF